MPRAIWRQLDFTDALGIHIVRLQLDLLALVHLYIFGKAWQVSECHFPSSKYEVLERLQLCVLGWTAEEHILH